MAADVSVIVPAFNAASTVAAAVQSALNQSVPPIEVIVVDDGSSDDTAHVAAACGPRVQVIRQANGGPGAARNAGIRAARGSWIGLLDADDTWMPTKLERQLTLDTDPHIGIIACLSDKPGQACPPEIGFDQLWDSNLLVNSTVLLRRAAWDAVGHFDEARALISVEDYNLWLRVSAAGWRILTQQEVLARYTRGVGISSNARRLLAASLFNLTQIERALSVPAPRVRARRIATMDSFAGGALHERDMPLARELGKGLVRTDPTPARLARLAVSYAPSQVLDAKRRVSRFFTQDGPPQLFGQPVKPVDPRLDQPVLLVIIDAEEEFDWSIVPSVTSGIKAMRHQVKAQRIFERFGCVPTYAVDYPVAAQREAFAPLLEYLQSDACEIGTQLHPWLNPPIEEELCERNSFPGNLPRALEQAKLRILTDVIETNLGVRPMVYRSGRYGLGPNTSELLAELGYRIDCSVRPHFASNGDGGPDYRGAYDRPFWLDTGQTVLELPVTVGMTGSLARYPRLLGPATHPGLRRLRLGGALARAGLLDRIQLTPEGTRLDEAKRLTRTMLADGHRLLVVNYHSPSLQPGNTPYVRNDADLQRFLAWLEGYFAFFLGEIGGRMGRPDAIYAAAARARDGDAAAAPC
ncbi:MAG: glycosyltransferase [Gemmatimonadaceae bacterium]|nr:glycosyltransferase [Acetobacteraceae bacterium]